MSDDPHQAFREASRYVRAYLEQVGRLLQDINAALARAHFRMLRQNGERLFSNLDSLASQPDMWLPKWLIAFYAPVAACGNANYGVQAAMVPRVPFVGVALTDEDAHAPVLWLGWVEGHDPNDIIEKKLQAFYDDLLDPPNIDPPPVPVAALADVRFTVSAVTNYTERVAFVQIPLLLMHGPAEISVVTARLVEAVRAA